MMRAWMMLPLALAGCGPRESGLPADPIQRAATCGVVAAADARRASGNVEAKLTIEQQGSILHYAMLEGAEGGRFDRTRAAAAVNAMPGLGDKVTTGKWEALIPQCQAAYPATKASGPVTLPADALKAQAGCYELADYFTGALRASEADYIERIRAYDGMKRKLDERMGATIRRQGLSLEQATEQRAEALGAVVALAPPTVVLDQCVTRFGS